MVPATNNQSNQRRWFTRRVARDKMEKRKKSEKSRPKLVRQGGQLKISPSLLRAIDWDTSRRSTCRAKRKRPAMERQLGTLKLETETPNCSHSVLNATKLSSAEESYLEATTHRDDDDDKAAAPPRAVCATRRNTSLVGRLPPSRPGAFSIKCPPPDIDNDELEDLTDEELAFILCSSHLTSSSSGTSSTATSSTARGSTDSVGRGSSLERSLNLSQVFVDAATSAMMAEDAAAEDESVSGLLGHDQSDTTHGAGNTEVTPPSAEALNDKRHELEISPGEYVPYRGSTETMDAMRNGSVSVAFCHVCDVELLCVEDAELVICPDCLVISPVEDDTTAPTEGMPSRPCRIGGVGLGLKKL